MKNPILMGAIFLVLTSLFFAPLKSQNYSGFVGSEAEILSHMAGLDTSYWVIRDMANQYLSLNPDSASFRKKFWRWNYFWKSRVDSTGDFGKALEVLLQHRTANGNDCMCQGDGIWKQLGPFAPTTQVSGIIVSVYSPPSDSSVIYAGSNTGGLWKTTNLGRSWENKTDILGMPGMGVNTILGHPDPDSVDVLYIGTGYSTEFFRAYGLGVYKSLDGGDTWRETGLSWTNGVNINSRVIYKLLRNPQNPNVIYAIDEKEVYRSDDNGETWPSVFGPKKDVLPPNELLRDIEILPGDTSTIFLSSARLYPKDANIWQGKITTDISNNIIWTWTDITPSQQPPDTGSVFCENFNMAITDADPNNLYCTSFQFIVKNPDKNNDSATTKLRIFNKSTQQWTIINDHMGASGTGATGYFVQSYQRPVFEINPRNAQIMYFGGHTLFKSINGGQTFTQLTQYNGGIGKNFTHADIRALQIYQASDSGKTDTLLIGNDGGVSRNTIGGKSGQWLNLNNRGTPPLMSEALVVSQVFNLGNSSRVPGYVIGGLQDNGVARLLNGQWSSDIIGDGGEIIIDYRDPRIVYARGNSGLHQSVDSGGTYGSPILSIGAPDKFDPFYLDQSRKNPFDLSMARDNEVKRFLTSPTRVTINPNLPITSTISGKLITAIAIAPSNPDVIYIAKEFGDACDDRLYKSDPQVSGQFNNISLCDTSLITGKITDIIGGYDITDILIDPEDANRFWVSVVKYKASDAVFYTSDGGNSFSKFGTGLPALPVNALEYQVGSNNVIYAGTDIGVYRYDPSTETIDPNNGIPILGTGIWECFNGTSPNSIPPTIVTDIEIDYCQGLLHVSTFGRGIWESPLPPIDEWTISKNTTIEAGMVTSINNDLVVPPGKRLTILGKLNMGEGTHIKVKYGGELIIDGGIITNECGLTWEGIDVEGTAYQPQSGAGSLSFPNSLHGKVILKNAAIVEHATNAITTRGDGPIIWTAGGIIQAEDAIFRNNRRDIEFLEYKTQPNISYFENCDFLVDNDYRFTIIKPRVTLWGVRSVDFTACNFEIQNPNFLYQNDGIFSIDAGYTVEAACSGNYTPTGCLPGTPSTFKNLKNGIHATRSRGSQYQIIVDANTFEDNVNGVISGNLFHTQITRNGFIIGGAAPDSSSANTGITIHTGSGFRVEENTFTGITTSQAVSLGTHIINTKEVENKIYKNTFSSLFVANLAARDNRSTTGTNSNSTGLQYLCNTQTNDLFDIAVVSGAGIRFFQGGPPSALNPNATSAQNLFSRNGFAESDFFNRSNNPIVLFYDNNVPTTMALDVSPILFFQRTGAANVCPSKINIEPGGSLDPTEKTFLIQQFNGHKADHQNLHFVYLSLIDAGDTEIFLDSINYEWAIDAWELRDNLLAESPNISLDALWEAANTGILPDAMLMEVLVANIGACQNDEFFNALVNEIPNPLPQYMVDLLIGMPEPPSLRQTLEEKLAFHSSLYSDAANLIIHDFLRDSIPNQDSLRLWYGKLGGMQAAYLVAESYLEEGNLSMAQSYMSGLANQYAYAEKYPDRHAAYVQLFDLKILLSQENRGWDNLTPTEIGELETLADEEKGDASVQAQNILRFFYDRSYEVPLLLPDATAAPQRLAYPSSGIQIPPAAEIRAFPNPARDYITFEYQVGDIESEVSIIVMDLSGRTIKTFSLGDNKGKALWDTREVSQGQYLFMLKSQEQILKSGRISIVK